MNIFDRLAEWEQRGVLSAEQHALLADLARGVPTSLFLELNILLYAGVLAFVGGLGWTVTTCSQQLGDVVVLVLLSALVIASLWYCFSRAPAWSPAETSSPSLIFDYVLYLGCLSWSVEVAYVEARFQLLSGQWDVYLLVSAVLFFALAYRFDNRLVLSLALSTLAGWFGLTISRWPANQDEVYRQSAVLYSLAVAAVGTALERRGWKAHFFGAYLNIAANVLFWTLLSGVFQDEGNVLWFVALLAACAASLAWGLRKRQFAFVAYAAVYGYAGVSSVVIRDLNDFELLLSYFFFTGIAMLVALVRIVRRFGRER